MIERENYDLLSGVNNIQTPIFLSLIGFRKSLSHHLGITDLPMIMHDNTKIMLKREKEPAYPYGFFQLNSIEVQRDAQAVKTVQRHSSAVSLDQITNALISKGYLFPTKLGITVRFIHNDIRSVIQFVEKLTILAAIDGFSFRVDMPGTSSWMVGVSMPDSSIQIPSDTSDENTQEPGAFDLTTTFIIDTKSGVVKSVPKINNEGIVTYSVTSSNDVTLVSEEMKT